MIHISVVRRSAFAADDEPTVFSVSAHQRGKCLTIKNYPKKSNENRSDDNANWIRALIACQQNSRARTETGLFCIRSTDFLNKSPR